MDLPSFRTDMIPSIDRIQHSSPKHAWSRMLRLLFQCSRKSEHRVLDVSIAPANGSGLLPSTLKPLHTIPRSPPPRKSTSLLLAKNPRRRSLNNNLQPLSFLWTRKRTPRNKKPNLRLGCCFGRKVSNPKARRRRCLCVELLVGIRRTKGRRKAKDRTSRSPGS